MILSPRYDDTALITLTPVDLAEIVTRQRRRLADLLATLTPTQWAHETRCEGWSVQDVVTHLVETNLFWTYSTEQCLEGSPTRLLINFDPVQDPARSVAAARALTTDEVRERFTRTTESLCAALRGLSLEQWALPAETPLGHVCLSALAHHALWDCWVHERDIVLPLGLQPDEESDEVIACLRYVAALGPAFALSLNRERRGALLITATEPDISMVLRIEDTVTIEESPPGGQDDRSRVAPDLELRGKAVELIDMVSLRSPLGFPAYGEGQWILAGLATVFDDPRYGSSTV